MFNLLPRRSPSLPQDDSPLMRVERSLELASAKLAYKWTDTNANLPGVPLASRVPVPDLPTLSWWLEVAEVAVQIVDNLVAVKLRDLGDRDAISRVEARMTKLRAHLGQVRESFQQSLAGHGLEDLGLAALPSVLRHCAALHEMVDELIGRGRELEQLQAGSAEASDLVPYRDLFEKIALPELANTFMTDDSFAYMRVAGPNPTLIAGVTALPKKLPLTEAQYQKAMPGDTLAEALATRRVYVLDYAELASLVSQPAAPKRVYAPIALFAAEKQARKLVPVAIQCGQDPAAYPLFLRAEQPDSEAYWAWQMAKSTVQVAEGNYHELFVHLSRTHLVIEAFCVATHRNLALRHPVHVLLLPHFEGTLFINSQAAGSLIGKDGPIARIFGATIDATQQAASSDRLAFDFYRHLLPIDLTARMVDDPELLPDYPYRDDGLLIWKAIEAWVKSYLALYYDDDGAVRADTELAAWADDLAGQGKIEGFPPITSLAQLRDVLTMVIFTASAQHAAVNFPQKPDMTFAPAISGAGWAPAPASTRGQTEAGWMKLMPPTDIALQQLDALFALGSVYYRVLGEYKTTHFPYGPWFEDPKVTAPAGPLAQFQATLKDVETTIRARNQERAVPYEFLLPSRIPPSINI